jgi:hypothetical protein
MSTRPHASAFLHRLAGIAVSAAAGLGLISRPTLAQVVPSGDIDRDTTWSGQITINGEVRISGATVRVEPGSTIRFAAPAGAAQPASIRLGETTLGLNRSAKETRLIFAGTPDRPITVETATDSAPGFITTELATGGSIQARHTVFRRLGSSAAVRQGEPAIFLVLNSSDHDLWLADCQFSECARVRAEFIGEGATAEISGCTFTSTAGTTAIEWIGTGEGLRVIRDNIADASFLVECPQVLVSENVLIGESAAINVATTTGQGISVIGNYVHSTITRDEGRYALKCDAPDAMAADNVLWGGTYVMERAPRTVTGNVLIGTHGLAASLTIAELDIDKAASSTTTHYLLANPAANARVSGNLFLGPAYAALTAGRDSPRIRIEHNLFDGWGVARRAIHLNQLSAARKDQPLSVVLIGNVFTRYRSTPIVDAARQIGTLSEVGQNVFAEVPEVLYDLAPGAPKMAPGDRRLSSFIDLRFKAPAATRSAMSVDDQLRRREVTVDAVRKMWLDAYQPLPGSPLTGSQPAGPRAASSPE